VILFRVNMLIPVFQKLLSVDILICWSKRASKLPVSNKLRRQIWWQSVLNNVRSEFFSFDKSWLISPWNYAQVFQSAWSHLFGTERFLSMLVWWCGYVSTLLCWACLHYQNNWYCNFPVIGIRSLLVQTGFWKWRSSQSTNHLICCLLAL